MGILGPRRPGPGSAGRARQGRCKPRPSDHLLPKPVRPLLPPAKVVNGAGRGCLSLVRGCPLGTVPDRCEWHACGTASEDDPRTPWRRWLRLDRRMRPVLGNHRLVGKSPKGLAAGRALVSTSPGLGVHTARCALAQPPERQFLHPYSHATPSPSRSFGSPGRAGYGWIGREEEPGPGKLGQSWSRWPFGSRGGS